MAGPSGEKDRPPVTQYLRQFCSTTSGDCINDSD